MYLSFLFWFYSNVFIEYNGVNNANEFKFNFLYAYACFDKENPAILRKRRVLLMLLLMLYLFAQTVLNSYKLSFGIAFRTVNIWFDVDAGT